MSRHLLEVIERDHFRMTPSGRVVMHDGEPVLDDGPAIQAIAQLLRVQEPKARLMGLDAPTHRPLTSSPTTPSWRRWRHWGPTSPEWRQS
jgi:hypothetical protein